MNHIRKLFTILLCSLGIVSTVWGAELPAYYPKVLPPMSGIIDRIDIKRGELVVNDIHWMLSMNTKVHSLNTEFSSLRTLRSGMKVSIDTRSMNGKAQVTEIWILPTNFIPSRGPMK